MADDSHGMGIPLPADSTPIHQYPAVARKMGEKVAEILAGGITEATADVVRRQVDAAVGPALSDEIRAAGLLTGVSEIDESIAFSITDKAGRRSWIEAAEDGRPTANSIELLASKTAIPVPMLSDTAAFSITDEDGRRSWIEAGTDGRPTKHAVQLLTEAGLGAGGAGSAPSAVSQYELADRFTDEKRNLTVRDAAGAVRPLTSNPKQIAFWGDSLLDGYPKPPFSADQSDSLPGRFASLVPGATVHNGGKSGQSADEIAIRQGGLVPLLTVAGGTIPASGAVSVSTDARLGWRLDRGIDGTTGSLAGVPGRLTRAGAALTFTRTAPGDAVQVAGPAPWESYGRAYAGGVQIILAGRNDIGYASEAGDVVDRVLSATRAMVESLTPMHPRLLLLGTITATSETAGTNGHTQVTAINAGVREMYPQYFWDYRAWLVKDAIKALGITPTATDLSRIAGDTLPPSIMVPGDGVHYSPATAAAAAARIKTELTNRGWI